MKILSAIYFVSNTLLNIYFLNKHVSQYTLYGQFYWYVNDLININEIFVQPASYWQLLTPYVNLQFIWKLKSLLQNDMI